MDELQRRRHAASFCVRIRKIRNRNRNKQVNKQNK